MARVLLGMSGGVDSSVAALVLLEQGHEVIGATMRLVAGQAPGGRPNSCCSQKDVDDARSVCDKLGIRHVSFDLDDEFEREVIERWADAYESGLTPNPCIFCNRHMKFERFWDLAQKMGCEAMATGHYARTDLAGEQGRARLLRAKNLEKDQSYVLWTAPQDVLAHLILPLGEFSSKDEVRAKAEAAGLITARKRDSQDICFVPDGDWAAYLDRRRGHASEPGHIVDTGGRFLGWHGGQVRYTLGQRKGLGVQEGRRLYVVSKDAQGNTLVMGEEDELYSESFFAAEANWVSLAEPARPVEGEVAVCYQGRTHPCTVEVCAGGRLSIRCSHPVRAVAPGQSAVIYDGDTLICGGIILP